jgi:hypothetical protein
MANEPGVPRILEELREERRRSDERFAAVMREFREDSLRRDTARQKAWRDLRTEVRSVGLAIVRSLNRNSRILEHIRDHHGRTLEHIRDHHGQLLERIDRNLGARRNGPPRGENGRRR